MEFKAGDRVHVIQHNGKAVDFYATLRELSKNFFLLTNCTDEKFKGDFIRKSEINCFGPNKTDFYTLATDKEDSELLTIERDDLIKDIEKLREEKAAIEMYLDAVKVYKPMYEEVNKKYNKLTEHIRLKALHNPSISRYKDLMCFINEMEGK